MTSSVADVPPSSLGDGELIAALENIEARRRSDYAHELRIVAELDGRNVALDNGCSDVAALLRQVLRINPAAARRYVAHTRALIHSYSTTGAVIDPDLPDVAEALGQGAVDPEHVEVIRATVAKFPRPVSLEDRTKAEQILLAASREHEPAIITRLGREILQRLDQDGTPPDDAELARPRRSLDLCEYAGGRLRGSFDLDPETGVLLTNLLSPHTAPCEADDGPDPRSRAERQADGLAEILRLAAACPQGPTEA
ncbi:MAG: DUF222 domain-containing protein, partial [Pseudonocardiaceae bacterium]